MDTLAIPVRASAETSIVASSNTEIKVAILMITDMACLLCVLVCAGGSLLPIQYLIYSIHFRRAITAFVKQVTFNILYSGCIVTY